MKVVFAQRAANFHHYHQADQGFPVVEVGVDAARAWMDPRLRDADA